MARTVSGPAAIYAQNATTKSVGGAEGGPFGVYANVATGTAVLGIAGNADTESYGVAGIGNSGTGVFGWDNGSGVGVYGHSVSGLAGEFTGDVSIWGTLSVGSITYTSDKNLKADLLLVDGKDLLDRVSALPISSWVYKTDSGRRHIGPMAQDFHAAFGLNGTDDTHINVTDIAGVSLAAIKELSTRDARKDAAIADLESQLALIKRQYAQMQAALIELQADQRVARR